MATNYVGYKVRVDGDVYFQEDGAPMLEFMVIHPGDDDLSCDFCLDGVAAYEIDAESVLGDGGQNTFYCQSCATTAATEDGPDEWIAPAAKMYLACRQCGEVFDDLTIAHGHAGTCGSDQGWDVVTESEAF